MSVTALNCPDTTWELCCEWILTRPTRQRTRYWCLECNSSLSNLRATARAATKVCAPPLGKLLPRPPPSPLTHPLRQTQNSIAKLRKHSACFKIRWADSFAGAPSALPCLIFFNKLTSASQFTFRVHRRVFHDCKSSFNYRLSYVNEQ